MGSEGRHTGPASRARRLLARGRRLPGTAEQLDEVTAQLLEARHQLLEAQLAREEARDALLTFRHAVQHQVVELSELVARTAERHAEDVAALRAELVSLRDERTAADAVHGRSVAAVAEAVARLEAPGPDVLAGGPLVSVVMAVRDRGDVVATAIESVRRQTYRRWELLVVDDGSVDGTAAAVSAAAGGDARVVVLAGAGRGVAAARNVALATAVGEVVAYLDSDNRWLPTYLAHVVDALGRHPDATSTVAQQLVVDDRTGAWWVRDDDRPWGDLEGGNVVDLNAFAHRRSLVAQLGAFDEDLRRLSDWDLVRRYVGPVGPVRLGVAGSVYRLGRPDQISAVEPLGHAVHLVREKHRPVPGPGAGLTVLCAEWHYPQLSETYVQADIEGLKALGARVEVWSEEADTAAPFPTDEVVHRGDLHRAIADARPDVVLSHWLDVGLRLAPTVAAAGVPMVVRGHGFDFSPARVSALLDHPGVLRTYLFPHLAARAPDHRRVRALPVGFDVRRYPPAGDKDRRLVVRTGVAIPTKDYEVFFEVAARCPRHRFVLCVATAHRREGYVDELRALHEASGSPAELRVDVAHDEVASLVGEAGIALHTHGGARPFGMPISIAEAMATGGYVVAPDLPGCAAYTGDAADRYADAAHASAFVSATLDWSDDDWRVAHRRSVDRAYGAYTNVAVAERLLADWSELGIVGR